MTQFSLPAWSLGGFYELCGQPIYSTNNCKPKACHFQCAFLKCSLHNHIFNLKHELKSV